MTIPRSRRAFVAALIAGATVPFASRAGAQNGTPVDHEAHHAGTPAATEAPDSTPTAGMDPAETPGTVAMMAMEFDLMFIDMMTQHHAAAVAMAEVAVERAEHPEVAQLAGEIISGQNAETEQLATWREQWYPDAPVVTMQNMMSGMDDMMGGMDDMMGSMSGMDMMSMMDPEMAAESMRSAPEPFDQAFLNAMIPHHLSALMMSEMAVQNAGHPELVELAQAMFETQMQEIQRMGEWRSAWYDTTATPGS